MLEIGNRNEIIEHGLSVEEVERQIELITSGVKTPKLIGAAKIGNGVISFDEKQLSEAVAEWEEKSPKIKAVKFIPASGAATRMFKALNYIYHNCEEITLKKLSEGSNDLFSKAELFFRNFNKFPFAEDVPSRLKNFGEEDNLFPLLDFLFDKSGLNFADSPKGLIKFHKYASHSHTPVGEHVAEAAEVLKNQSEIKLHFTVSPRFEERFKKHFEELNEKYSDKKIVFEHSFQHPSTDTIVWDGENLLRNKNGEIVFRPGGHGALLKNLNEIDADLIFIKNIDNVSKRSIAQKAYPYKKLLGSLALKFAETIGEILRKLERNELRGESLEKAVDFAKEKLNVFLPSFKDGFSEDEIATMLFEKLNRPLRVAAMVKNTGEPGGGPFWVKDDDGTPNLQIVEKAQIDIGNEEQREILNSSTHFNPVDLACYVRNYKGEKFDLLRFANHDYGIITEKNIEGKDVKVLELPGLWNAAMWNWITVFVDVPLFTFTPVKEVTDLLKPEHYVER